MFLLHLEDTSAVSAVGDPTLPGYSPIYIELDSTDENPPPTPWFRGYVSLPAGYTSIRDAGGLTGGVVIRFEGTTAGLWQLTADNPALIVAPVVVKELRLDVLNNIPTPFWMRGTTIYGEVPVDDRSVALRVSGQVEEI